MKEYQSLKIARGSKTTARETRCTEIKLCFLSTRDIYIYMYIDVPVRIRFVSGGLGKEQNYLSTFMKIRRKNDKFFFYFL